MACIRPNYNRYINDNPRKTTIDELHIMESESQVKDKFYQERMGKHYLILDTAEKGRILFVHTEDNGSFGLETENVVDIFMRNHCDCTITCFPQLHYLLEKSIAVLLNVQYPDICMEIRYNVDYFIMDCPVMLNYID
jgi:hypothetical protein